MDESSQTTEDTQIVKLPFGALAILIGVVIAIYSQLARTSFIGFDDSLHVYANPYLNPPTFANIAMLWKQPYAGLYVPLAYTFFAVIAHFAQITPTFDTSLGEPMAFSAGPFHVVNIVFHAANIALVYALVKKITNKEMTGWVCAAIFGLHPLQVESVAWVSELRGLSGNFFALLTLLIFAHAREHETESKARFVFSIVLATLTLICGMLCKPSVIALPLAALAIDRIAFQTSWRKALPIPAIWCALILPIVKLTSSIQLIVPAAQSQVWQRPFVAGDALAFYLGKFLVPFGLCVDYGRTPHALFTHWWAFFSFLIPLVLCAVAFRFRKERPMIWLGTILAVVFLLPVLGLIPFSFQEYSTVSDRYAYLSLIGLGLIAGDLLKVESSRRGMLLAVAVSLIFALISNSQAHIWRTNSSFLEHTIAVNPNAAFAYNNLGSMYAGNDDYQDALKYMQEGLALDPSAPKNYTNVAEMYIALGDDRKANAFIDQADQLPMLSAEDWSDIGVLEIEMDQPQKGLAALAMSVKLAPDRPQSICNYAHALLLGDKLPEAARLYRRCIALVPSFHDAHKGLGEVLMHEGRYDEASAEFQTASELIPGDPMTIADIKQLQDRMSTRSKATL